MKEGDDISIKCVPSTSTVGLEWEIPTTASNTGSVVEYDEPLRHTITIQNANKSHEGHYTCRVVGDVLEEISSDTAFVKVRESKKLPNINGSFLLLSCIFPQSVWKTLQVDFFGRLHLKGTLLQNHAKP